MLKLFCENCYQEDQYKRIKIIDIHSTINHATLQDVRKVGAIITCQMFDALLYVEKIAFGTVPRRTA